MKPQPAKKVTGQKQSPVKKATASAVIKPAAGPIPWFAIITVVIAAFIFYGNTLTLKYAYDDTIVITGNQFTKQGIKGIGDILTTDFFTGYFGKDQNMVSGGRYRPLSLITFALEYQFFGENPAVSHFFNVLLFAAVGILLLLLVQRLARSAGLMNEKHHWYLSVPLLASLLFIAHPIHTEVVANIKSRDEIMALLFCLLTVWFSLKYLDNRKIPNLILSGCWFFLALLSKENSVTFVVVLPVTIWFFTRASVKENLFTLIPLVASTVIFLLIRQAAIGHSNNPLTNDLMNNPFVEMTIPQKYATILYTLGLYIKLLIFPHPLTSDYYPYHIPIINPGDWRALLSLGIYLFMIAWIILKFRKKDLVAWSFIFFLVTLSIVSNLLFPIGAFMNERFIFVSSIAFSILSAAGIILVSNKLPSPALKKPVILTLMTVILVLYGFKTITRNLDWYDSYTLFTTDVKVSQNSAKGNETAGEFIMNKANTLQDKKVKDSMYRVSIAYQQKAIRIYPKQIIALINLAAVYYSYNQDYDTILTVYKTILGYLPNNAQIYTYFNTIMSKYNNTDHKISLYKDLLTVNPERWDVNINLGSLYLGGKQDAASALPYLEKAATLKPDDFDSHKQLGTAYGMLRRWNDSRMHLERADNLKPGDQELIKNLAIVYQNMGEMEKARQMAQRLAKQ